MLQIQGSENNKLDKFNHLVGTRYEMYNSFFTSLPFHKVEKTGVLLSLFLLHCEDGFQKEESPEKIVNGFFTQLTNYPEARDQVDLLFRFIQYSERQVVLFDALEDAAFPEINDMNGPGTMAQLQSQINHAQAQGKLKEVLRNFSVRLVLTAHPTQFYPSEVLSIIHDLSKALVNDDTALINSYLQQLGKTPFFKKQKPTPYDEALNLIWFLENVFYESAGYILTYLKNHFPDAVEENKHLMRMGFWPGGDRDGNPYVQANTTLNVAESLRKSILKRYYHDVHYLRRRLTFRGVEETVVGLEEKLYNNAFVPGHKVDISKEEILENLDKIRHTLIEYHNSLFLNLVESFRSKVELFGLFFASLDIRQDSSAHEQVLDKIAEKTGALPDNYSGMNENEKIEALLNVPETVDPEVLEDDVQKDTIQSMQAMKEIQQINGEEGCHRYIISHSTSALSIMEVYGLLQMAGWNKKDISVDIVPLFETIDDLKNAAGVMRQLYETKAYREHLKKRNNTQTIMLGFSDGTKDGGYLMANWSIYKAKEYLTMVSEEYGIQVVFFDGRGGPPARGGGKTHQFYASMGNNIANQEIQLTVQGQTVSSNFGTIDSARFNMEQLMHAGIYNAVFASEETTLSSEQESLLQELANEGYEEYNKLKHDPNFLEYLNYASPLRYYGQTNIGSRPSKRSQDKLTLDSLRAVPYVGSWSQLKQNIPGYYGVGTALEKMDQEGRWDEVQALYENSLYFKTLIDNCEMAMNKSFFPLTKHFSRHPKYGDLWNKFHDEYLRTEKYVLRLTGREELMADKPVDKMSIQMRQRIELPLVTIQQYALGQIRKIEEEGKGDDSMKEVYEKLVIRCSFGIINAERNSA